MEEHGQLNLAQQVAHLAQQVAHLEGRLDSDERSTPKRVAMWGSFLALVVAISVGAFQLWDGLVLRKQVALEAKQRELGSYVRRITELNSHSIELYSRTSGPNPDLMAIRETHLLNLEKISIVRLADRLLSQDNDIGSYAVFYSLSFEHLNLGDTVRALAYGRKAESLSQSNGEVVASGCYTARALLAPGKTQDTTAAHKKFEQLLALAKKEIDLVKVGLLANIYDSWIISEVTFGDCEMVADLMRRMAADFSEVPNSKNSYLFVRQQAMDYAKNTLRCKAHISKAISEMSDGSSVGRRS